MGRIRKPNVISLCPRHCVTGIPSSVCVSSVVDSESFVTQDTAWVSLCYLSIVHTRVSLYVEGKFK